MRNEAHITGNSLETAATWEAVPPHGSAKDLGAAAILQAKQEVAQRCYEIAKESTAADDIAAKIAGEFRLKEKA
jgi:hypothetical protein